MAHCITKTDGVMSVREVPWHGIGTILPDLATAKEAIAAAKLNWYVDKQPVGFINAAGDFEAITDKFATIRTDIGDPLGIVGKNYKPLQNADAFSFLDQVTQDPDGPKYVTAGSLNGGRKTWALLQLPSFIEVTPGKDVINEYILLANSHDGSQAVTVTWTPVRVVCQNTLTLALNRASNNGSNSVLRVKHFTGIYNKVNEAQDLLGIIRQDRLTFVEAVTAMQSYEPTEAQVNDVLETLFTGTSSKNGEDSTRVKNVRNEVLTLFHSGNANVSAGDTKSLWALYNGITEYADHDRAVRSAGRDDVRLDSNWFGTAATLKVDALNTVMAVLG